MPILKYKIVFLGDQNVGKTSIITRFIYDSFQGTKISTVGIDFLTKTLQVDNQTIRLQLWDTAGQQRFRSLIPGYIKDADCCIIVCDASNKNSFQSFNKWIDFVRDARGKDAMIFLVCNKIDVQNKQIESSTVNQYANLNTVHFQEVSAKNGKNVLTLFRKIIKLLEKPQQIVSSQSTVKRVDLTEKNILVNNPKSKCSC